MAFCTFCGKQLADGEVCTCQQSQASASNTVPQGNEVPQGMPYQATPNQTKPSQASGGFSEWGKFFVKSFKKPFEAAEDFFENGTMFAAGISLVVLMLVYALTNLCYVAFRAMRGAMYYASHDYSYYYSSLSSYLRGIYGITPLSYVGAFFLPILWCVVMAAVVFGLACAINALFIKDKFDMRKIMTFAAAPTIGLMVLSVLQIIMFAINNRYGNILFRIAFSCVGLVVLLQVLTNLKKLIEDRYKFLAALGITVAGLMIGNYIITGVIDCFTSNFITLPF